MRALFVSSGDLASLQLGVSLGARFGSSVEIRIGDELPEGWRRIETDGLPESVRLAEPLDEVEARAIAAREAEAAAIAARLAADPDLAAAVAAARR